MYNRKTTEFDTLVTSAYDQLRLLARRIRTRTLANGHHTTSLVHEAYLRLSRNKTLEFESEEHFLGVAGKAMRRLIVDRVRKSTATKRGGGQAHFPLMEEDLTSAPDTHLLNIDEALDQLASFDKRKCQVVELRFFGGCSVEQTAKVLGISPATVAREWDLARSWIFRELSKA